MQNYIIIHAYRWFQKTYGNTYHSVYMEINGIQFVEPFIYGYGDQYQQTALSMLKKHLINYDKLVSADSVRFWQVKDDLELKGWLVKVYCQDVDRKKDL